MKPLLIDKVQIHNNEVIIKEGNKTITHFAYDNNILDTVKGIALIQKPILDHSSISRIKQNSSIQGFFFGDEICLTIPNELLKLLKEIDTKKTLRWFHLGFEMIPPRFVKIAGHVLWSPYSKVINVTRCY